MQTTYCAKCWQPAVLNTNNLLCLLSPAAFLAGWKMFLGDIPPPCGSQTTETMVPKILLYPGNRTLAEGECRSLVSARGGSITREDISNSSNRLSERLTDRPESLSATGRTTPVRVCTATQSSFYSNLALRNSGMDSTVHHVLLFVLPSVATLNKSLFSGFL